MAVQPLESELLSMLGGDWKARVAARYCGFDGLGGATLQSTGAEFGVTAERVRQVIGEVVRRRGGEFSPAPVLLETISFIAHRIPALADDIETQLQAAGLSFLPFRIEGVIRATEWLGTPLPFCLSATPRFRLVHSLPPRCLDAIIQTARRAIERRGLVSLDAFSTELLESVPEAVDRRLIVDVLTGTDEIRWLDPAQEWFWLPSVARNPVVRRIRKILSVTNPIRLAKLNSAFAHEYRLQSYAPPVPVLQELCRQIPGVRVSGECVITDPPIRPREVLGELEGAIVEVLTQSGGFMQRSDLAVACLQRGLNRASFYSALAHSPVIALSPSGLVGLVGVEPAHEALPNPAANPRSKYLHSKARAHTIHLRKWMQ